MNEVASLINIDAEGFSPGYLWVCQSNHPALKGTASLAYNHSMRHLHLGCVSFLNAKPLIDGLVLGEHEHLDLAVPSRLLDGLENGQTDMALCPVIDFQRSKVPLVVVPVGGIGCDGPTLTVRLFSRVPLDRITQVYADTDSHTSIALLRVLLWRLHQVKPMLIDLPNVSSRSDWLHKQTPEAVLLIGDKVVTQRPEAAGYPYDVDLGDAWRNLTGLPFVFATWLARADAKLNDLPGKLNALRLANEQRIDDIVARHAGAAGWPHDLARQYLGHWLKYDIGPRQLQAMQLFWQYAHQAGVIGALRPMKLWPSV